MIEGWDNYEPAPIEYLHGRFLDLFHEWRRTQTNEIMVSIDGTTLNKIFAQAKTETYTKYKTLYLDKAILKADLLKAIVDGVEKLTGEKVVNVSGHNLTGRREK